jgi:hypothetical protein
MKLRKVAKLFRDRGGVSAVISNVILVGAVIAVGFSVMAWTYSQSSLYQAQYRESVSSDIDKLRERVSFEYVFYNNNTKSLSVYLMNSGKVDNVNFTTVYIRDFSSSSPIATFTSDHFQLTFLSPPQQPTHDLDMGEEGHILLDLSSVTLQSGNAYTVKVETRRSSYFESMFKA